MTEEVLRFLPPFPEPMTQASGRGRHFVEQTWAVAGIQMAPLTAPMWGGSIQVCGWRWLGPSEPTRHEEIHVRGGNGCQVCDRGNMSEWKQADYPFDVMLHVQRVSAAGTLY